MQRYDQSQLGGPVPGLSARSLISTASGGVGIVVADSGALPTGWGYRGVRLIDGRTGATRWRRPMRPHTAAKDGVAQIIAAPDLDGDGTPDLVTVSLFDGRKPPATFPPVPEEPRRVYVDAISGRDGRALWWWKPRYRQRERHGSGSPRGGAAARMAGRSWRCRLAGQARRQGCGFACQSRVPIPAERSPARSVDRGRAASHQWAGTSELCRPGRGRSGGPLGRVQRRAESFPRRGAGGLASAGPFRVADSTDYAVETCRDAGVDFDGDGIADTLVMGVHAPGGSATRRRGAIRQWRGPGATGADLEDGDRPS